MMEWKPIPNHPDYFVSSCGEVLSIKQLSPKRLRTSPTTRGYRKIGLNQDGRAHQIDIHRLVAAAFLGPSPGPGYEVNHKNRIKTDNTVSNLEWVTKQENTEHAYANGGYKFREENSQSKLTEQEVLVIRKLKGIAYQKDLAKAFGVTQTLISVIQRGAGWKSL